MKFTICIGALILAALSLSGEARASSLASGYALYCPEHVGTRVYRSRTVSAGTTQIYIVSTARKDNVGCKQTIALHLTTGANENVFEVGDVRYFSIIDISPDGKWLLLDRQLTPTEDELKNDQYEVRRREFSVVSTANPEPHWRNVWDIMGWGLCKANVDAEALLPSGKVIAYLRGTIMNIPVSRPIGGERPEPDRSKDCVNSAGFYEIDLATGAKQMVAKELAEPHAVVSGYEKENCKTNPDVVGNCFKIRGRINEWNGSMTTRIWPVGTNRMLYVAGTLPEKIQDRYGFNVDVFANLEICRLEKDIPGHMRGVCIESAENIRFEER